MNTTLKTQVKVKERRLFMKIYKTIGPTRFCYVRIRAIRTFITLFIFYFSIHFVVFHIPVLYDLCAVPSDWFCTSGFYMILELFRLIGVLQ